MPLSTTWLYALATTRVELHLQPVDPGQAHPLPAVAIRGALGDALWHIACVEPSQDCARCHDRSTCPIPTWFAPSRIGRHRARPFVLQVDPGPAAWAATLWVLGPSIPTGLLTQAIARMARAGIGRERRRYRLTRFVVTGADARELTGSLDAPWPAPAPLHDFVEVPALTEGARVHLDTPTWWGHCSRHRPPQPAELLQAAMIRVRNAAQAQGRSLDRWWPDPATVGGQWLEARFVKATRRQANTGRRLSLSGWVGTLQLDQASSGFADLLAASEVLNIGKRSSAGCGRVRISWPSS